MIDKMNPWVLPVLAAVGLCGCGNSTSMDNIGRPNGYLPGTYLLTVETIGAGSVTSSPAGINCGTSCTMVVEPGTKVKLTAATTTPYFQSRWDGCTAWNDTCEITMTKDQKVVLEWGPEVRPRLVTVPKGSFMMGSPTTEPGRGSDEVQHAVTLTTDFWMAESEVTQRQYRNLMGNNPSNFKGDDLPVELVSWEEAIVYCNTLSSKEKFTPCYQFSGATVGWADGYKCTGYRLPTEAEWEYAANPPTTPRTVYAGSDMEAGVAWIDTNSYFITHSVMTKAMNKRGIYDLSGNVFEWTWDWYQANYEALPSIDPIGPAAKPASGFKLVKGGTWYGYAQLARVAKRLPFYLPSDKNYGLGIRIVRSSP